MGVNTTVVPVLSARQGLGGWIEMIARLRKAQRNGGPGGIMKCRWSLTPRLCR
jgi:hypothetical protein